MELFPGRTRKLLILTSIIEFFRLFTFFLFFFGWLVTIKGGLLSSTFYNRKCTNISVPLGKKTCCKLSNHGCSESFHKFITQTLYEGFLAFLGCVVVLVLAIFIISSLTLNSYTSRVHYSILLIRPIRFAKIESTLYQTSLTSWPNTNGAKNLLNGCKCMLKKKKGNFD